MMLSEKFVPCKECIDCCLSPYEDEPLYFCRQKPNVLYTSIKDMVKHCPYEIE